MSDRPPAWPPVPPPAPPPGGASGSHAGVDPLTAPDGSGGPGGPDATTVHADGGAAGGRRRSRLRVAFYTLSSALVVWAALAVPLPFVEFVPGTPTDIRPLIEIDGVEVTELDGSTSLLAVIMRQQATLPAFTALLSPARQLQRVEQVYPPGLDRDDYLTAERERFGRQFDVAAAVGAQAAGVEVDIVTQAVIVNVLGDGPSAGLLRPGDTVLAIDGEPIDVAEELQAAALAGQVGDELTLLVRRGASDVEVVVALGALPGVDGARLGVGVRTAVDRLRLPFDVRLAEGNRIGGPSAGLLIGLTVYDLLADENLLDGRQVMGTGTLDANGAVGVVGGVPEKMRAAARHGADLVLVPRSQYDEARAALPDGIELVGVDTLQDAIEALRRVPA